MTKRKAIISYAKLTIDQKKQILRDFPDGYINHLTTIKIPTGEVIDTLIWETDEVIYLVKINNVKPKKTVVEDEEEDEEDEDDFEDDLEKVDNMKDEEMETSSDDEDEEDYDKPDKDNGEDEDED